MAILQQQQGVGGPKLSPSPLGGHVPKHPDAHLHHLGINAHKQPDVPVHSAMGGSELHNKAPAAFTGEDVTSKKLINQTSSTIKRFFFTWMSYFKLDYVIVLFENFISKFPSLCLSQVLRADLIWTLWWVLLLVWRMELGLSLDLSGWWMETVWRPPRRSKHYTTVKYNVHTCTHVLLKVRRSLKSLKMSYIP